MEVVLPRLIIMMMMMMMMMIIIIIIICGSDVWLTVHRNSVWIRKTN